MHRLLLIGLLAFSTIYVVEVLGQERSCDGGKTPCYHGTCATLFRQFRVCSCDEGYVGRDCNTDTKAPVLVCPETMTTSTDPGINSTSVSFGPMSMSDNSGSEPNLYAIPPSGSIFYYGQNEVQLRANDSSGNEATCTFTIHVKDTEPPVVTCPNDMVYLISNGEVNKAVDFAADNVIDNVDQDVTVTSSPSSGSEFLLGTSVVQMTAVDESQNVGSCNFTVTVREMLTCDDGSALDIDDECNYIWDCSDGGDENDCVPELVEEMVSILHPSDENGTFKFQVEEGSGIHITINSNYSRGGITVGEGSQPGEFVLFYQGYVNNNLDIFLPSGFAWVIFTARDENQDGFIEVVVEPSEVTRSISIDSEGYDINQNESSARSVYVWRVNAPEGTWIRGSYGEERSRFGYRFGLFIEGMNGQLIDVLHLFGGFGEFLLPVETMWISHRGDLDYPISLVAQDPNEIQLPEGNKQVVSFTRTLQSQCSMESLVINLPEPHQYAVRLRDSGPNQIQGNVIIFEQELEYFSPVGVVQNGPQRFPSMERSLVAHLTKRKVVLLTFPDYNCPYRNGNLDEVVVELEFKAEDLTVQLEEGDVFSLSSVQNCYSEDLAFNRRVFTSNDEIFVEAKFPLLECSIFYNGSFPEALLTMTPFQPSFRSSLIGVSSQDIGILDLDLQSSPFASHCPYYIDVHPSVPDEGYMVCSDGRTVVSQEQVCNTMVNCPDEKDEIDCAPREVEALAPVSLVAIPKRGAGTIYTFQKTNTSQRFLLDARLLSSYGSSDLEVLAVGTGRYFGQNSTVTLVLTCRDLVDEGKLLALENDVIWIKVMSSEKPYPFFGTISVVSNDDYVDCGKNIAISNDRRCDGLHQCPTGSDEMNCVPLPVGESVALVLPSRSQDTDVITWTFTTVEDGILFLNLQDHVKYDYRYIAVGTGSDPSDNATIIEQWNRYEDINNNIFVPGNAVWIKMEPRYFVPRISPGSVFVSRVTEFNLTRGMSRVVASPDYPQETTDDWVGLWVFRFPTGMGGLIECSDTSVRSGTLQIGAGDDFKSNRSIVTLVDTYRYDTAEIQIPSDTVWISAAIDANSNSYYRRGTTFSCSVSTVDVTIPLLGNDTFEIEYRAVDDQFVWTGWRIEAESCFTTLFNFDGEDYDRADIGIGTDFEENVTARYFFPSNDQKRDVAINGSVWTFLSSQSCYYRCVWSYTVSAVANKDVLTCDGYVFMEDDVCNNRTTCFDGTDENGCVTARLNGGEGLLLFPPYRQVTDLIWSVTVEAGFQPLVRFRNIDVRYDEKLEIGSSVWRVGKSPLAVFDRSNSSFDVLIPCEAVWIRFYAGDRTYSYRRPFEVEISAVEADDFFACTESVVVINSTLVCDGEPNCPYGDDEIGCEILEGESATLISTDYPRNRPGDIMQKWEYHTNEDNIAMVVHFRELYLRYSERFYAGIGELSPENSSVDYRPAIDCYLTPYDPVGDLYLESNMIWINIDSEYTFNGGGRMWAEVRVVKSNDDFIRCNDDSHIAALDQICDNQWTCEDGEDEIGCDAILLGEDGPYSLEFSDPPSFPEDTIRSWTFTSQKEESAIAIIVESNGYGFFKLTAGQGNDFMDSDSVVEVFRSGNRFGEIFVLGTDAWLTATGSLRYVEINVTSVSLSELYMCENSGRIISSDKVCDGSWDCKTGSDESECDPTFIDESENYVLSLSKTLDDSISTQSWIFEIADRREAAVELRSLNLHRAQLSIGTGTDPSNVNTRLIATIDEVERLQWMVSEKFFWLKTVVGTGYSSLYGTVEIKSIPPTPNTCDDDAFQCSFTRECIEASTMCDGTFDCEDGSDEISCDCASPLEVRCGTGECVSRLSLCSGYSYRTGAACLDEVAFCDFECPAWNARTIISNRFVCDGYRDCVDGSDEEVENCDCKPPAFSCGNKCISPNQVCDGYNNCENGTDEMDCECSSFEVACEEDECIAYWDGCMEDTCMNVDECRACPPNYFQCQDYTCLPQSSVCNFVNDCFGGEDEEGCPNISTIRLVGGTSISEGRVEIFHDGEWGTVCDDLWDYRDAAVVCRQLGFGESGDAVLYARYGSGIGPIWLDNVGCSGSESRLEECRNSGWGVHNCGHYEDAGVRCDYDPPSVRLAGGNTTYEGRVEVFYEGEWGTVCDDDWDENDAAVVCRQLGLGMSGEAFRTAKFGAGVGPIWLDNVACTGYEHRIESCRSNGFGDHNCGHYEDAGVRCSGDMTTLPPTRASSTDSYDVTMERSSSTSTTTGSNGLCGSSPCQNGGICLDFGTISLCLCPDGVTGRYCETLVSTSPPAVETTAPLNLPCNEIPCRNGGTCFSLGNGVSYLCFCPRGYSGLNCETFVTIPPPPNDLCLSERPCRNGAECITLVDSYICLCEPEYFGLNCEFSTYGEEEYLTTVPYEGDLITTDIPYSLDVTLSADSPVILMSPGYPESLPKFTEGTWTISAPSGHGIQIEVVDVDVGYNSRFELGTGNTVGRNRISDFDRFNSYRDFGALLFRSSNIWLTFTSDNYARNGRGFVLILTAIEGIGITHINYLMENETMIIESPNYPENYPVKTDDIWNFEATEGLGFVVTFSDFSLEENWDYVTIGSGNEPTENAVTSKFTGYSIPESQSLGSSIWMRFTSDLSNTSRGFRAEVKAVARSTLPSALRLVGGRSRNEGRVEIFYNGMWGTVCDDSWDRYDAQVVCRELGLGGYGDALSYAAFGRGVGPIWLDDVRCNGDELRLEDCPSNGWGIHNCGHSEDAGVRCRDSSDFATELPPGFTEALPSGDTIILESNSPHIITYYDSYGYNYDTDDEVWNLIAPQNHSIQISFSSIQLDYAQLETRVVFPTNESILIAKYSGYSTPDDDVIISSSNVQLIYISGYHSYGDDSFTLAVTAIPNSVEECESDAIPALYRCNGKSECVDSIDELNCDFNYDLDNNENATHPTPFVRIGDSYGKVSCGGTVINSRWALTAAECMTQRSTSSYEVLVGVEDFPKNYTADDTHSVVAEIEVNAANGSESGLALLKLDRPLEGFGTYVIPLSLPNNGSVPSPGTYVNVFGWSRAAYEEEEVSAFITLSREPVVSEEFCRMRENPPYLMGGGFCTGYIQSYGFDCFNIFGGPVVHGKWSDTSRTIVGVVMRQPSEWNCGQLFTPKMHPLVSSHVDFIRDIMRYV